MWCKTGIPMQALPKKLCPFRITNLAILINFLTKIFNSLTTYEAIGIFGSAFFGVP